MLEISTKFTIPLTSLCVCSDRTALQTGTQLRYRHTLLRRGIHQRACLRYTSRYVSATRQFDLGSTVHTLHSGSNDSLNGVGLQDDAFER